MGEAASGQGVDRHLLGLYILSGEMGLPTPDIFTDKAYTLRLDLYRLLYPFQNASPN